MMNRRRDTPGNGIRNKWDTPGRGIFKNGSNGQDERAIPNLIKSRLRNQNEALVIMGIKDIMRSDPRSGRMQYREDEICDWLTTFIAHDPRQEVAEMAAKELVELLGRHQQIGRNNINQLVIHSLNEKNALNLDIYTNVISKTAISVEVRKWALNQLATYTEADIMSKATAIELILLERMMDAQEDNEIKSLIPQHFGPGRKGRPKIGVMHETRPEDMTIQIETGADAKPLPKKRKRELLGPTQDMDTIGLQIFLLGKEGERERQMGAKNLYETAMSSRNIANVERIVDAFAGSGEEFYAEYNDVRLKLARLRQREVHVRNTPTMPPQNPNK